MEHAYYVRYGLSGRVGRFSATCAALARGDTVVLQTHRGMELGEILLSAPANATGALGVPSPGSARLLRAATAEDLARAERAEHDRHRRFAACRLVFEAGVWPFDLIDVEPLLDDGRTVVHYLGPHDLDVSGLLAVFRSAHGLDVIFEAAGRDIDEPLITDSAATGCGHCGSGGGCDSGGCGTGSGHAGCTDCALMKSTLHRAAVVR